MPKFTKEDIEFVYNWMRKASVQWDGRKECLRLARKKVLVRRAKNGNPVYKYRWQCADCENWFNNEADLEVDHIVEVGGYTAFLDGNIQAMAEKIFPRPVQDHLQVLCLGCHMKKTGLYNAASTVWKRKSEL